MQTIDRLREELNKYYSQDVENDIEHDQRNVDTIEDNEDNESESNEGEDDEGGEDENEGHEGEDEYDSDINGILAGFGQTKNYSCPEFKCRQRKPDPTFKKYSRHYKTRNSSTASQAQTLG